MTITVPRLLLTGLDRQTLAVNSLRENVEYS